ncbi:MAG: hypothetical protein RPR40_06855 [Bermanella sp.]
MLGLNIACQQNFNAKDPISMGNMLDSPSLFLLSIKTHAYG